MRNGGKTKGDVGMRILTESKLDGIIDSAFERGYSAGRQHNINDYARGYREGKCETLSSIRSKQAEEKNRQYKEASVVIESVTLIKDASINRHQYYSTVFLPAQYEVKFRSKNGKTTNDMIVTFDSPNFSMADVRRKISEEFCGGGCK